MKKHHNPYLVWNPNGGWETTIPPTEMGTMFFKGRALYMFIYKQPVEFKIFTIEEP